MRIERSRKAERATGVLAVLLAGGGIWAAAITPDGRVLNLAPAAPPTVLFGCLTLAFLCAEMAPIHLALRRQAYSFSLSGLALMLGVLFYDAQMLLLARLTGAALVFTWQRLPIRKVTYNLGAYALETALVGLMIHLLLGSKVDLTLRSAATCFIVMGLVDLLMSALTLLVISWHRARITAYQAAAVFVPTFGLGVICTSAAVAVVALLNGGTLGVALVVECAIVSAVAYRGYLAMHSRHQSLTQMHDFVKQGVGASTVDDLAEVLLTRTRRLLNAGEVELTVFRDDSELRLKVTGDDVFTSTSAAHRSRDWLVTRVRENAESILIPRYVRERGLRQWLVFRHAREAMLVPLPAATLQAVLVVKNRRGEATTFTKDDLTLLQTLAGHIVVALRGTQLVQQLRHDANHDSLTGLANRVFLTEQIEQALRDANQDQRAGAAIGGPAVLLLDLDKFKEVNDALGHHVGDALLCVVGSRIGECLPEGATVARLGGDEFAILLPGTATLDTQVEARQLAHRVLASLSCPIVLPEGVVSTRASIGIAFSTVTLTGAEADSADLLRYADTAMYAAKAGESQVVIYTDDLDRGRAERLSLLADLHLALERDELELVFQPQVDLRTDQLVSVEALVRWRHPERGLLGPDQFIPLAESSGLIEGLTYQVLHKALAQCRRWRDTGIDLVVAVNLSAFNVNNANLAEDVAAALANADLPADRLILEITESSVMGDPRRTVPILQRLADIGVKLSLDDFGTGYSSLAYLQRLPVSEVKIDKSFITGLVTSGESQASSVLVRSILTLGSNLGLRVVAEGVEDEAVLTHLKELGCDLAQGFHIARPQSAEDICSLVKPTAARRGHLTALAS